MTTIRYAHWALFTIGCFLTFGCANSWRLFNNRTDQNESVRTLITTYNDQNYSELLNSKPTLNFISYTKDDIRYMTENREVVAACREAAEIFGITTDLDNKQCTDCIDVLTFHRFEITSTEGDSETKCSSYYGSWYGSTRCSTYRPVYARNNRWIGLTFLQHGEKKAIHQIDAYSTGNTSSVVQVALEMCYSAFLNFPQRMENRSFEVSRFLKYEKNQKPK